mgnify:CR=1 FL=1
MKEKPNRPPKIDSKITSVKFTDRAFLNLISEESGALSSDEAKRAYAGSNATTEDWEKAVAAGHIIEIYDGATMCYPAWQFRPEGGTLSGLTEVLEILKELPYFSGVTAAIFMLNLRAYLGGKSPLDVLRHPTQKSLARVIDLAKDELH